MNFSDGNRKSSRFMLAVAVVGSKTPRAFVELVDQLSHQTVSPFKKRINCMPVAKDLPRTSLTSSCCKSKCEHEHMKREIY